MRFKFLALVAAAAMMTTPALATSITDCETRTIDGGVGSFGNASATGFIASPFGSLSSPVTATHHEDLADVQQARDVIENPLYPKYSNKEYLWTGPWAAGTCS